MSVIDPNGIISKKTYERLIQVCADALPMEACGILASSSGSDIIDIMIPIRNVHEQPQHAFAFDPKEWTAAYYDIQNKRGRLIGLFHSHPHMEAAPSNLDRSGFLPAAQLTYWIVSFKEDRSPLVQPYYFANGGFERLKLVFA